MGVPEATRSRFYTCRYLATLCAHMYVCIYIYMHINKQIYICYRCQCRCLYMYVCLCMMNGITGQLDLRSQRVPVHWPAQAHIAEADGMRTSSDGRPRSGRISGNSGKRARRDQLLKHTTQSVQLSGPTVQLHKRLGLLWFLRRSFQSLSSDPKAKHPFIDFVHNV